MKAHAKSEYHMTPMVRMNEFLIRYQHPALAINVQHDQRLQETLMKNQNVLKSLLRVLCCLVESKVLHFVAIGMTILLGLKIVISIKLSWFVFEQRLMRSYKII